jgi:hypothetical protein
MGVLCFFQSELKTLIIKLQIDIENYCSRCLRLVDIWNWKYKNSGNGTYQIVLVTCHKSGLLHEQSLRGEKSHLNDTLQVFLQNPWHHD